MGKAIKIVSKSENLENGNESAPESIIPNTNKRRIKRTIHFRKRFILILLFLFAICFTIIKYAEYKMRPIIISMASANARSIASRIISEAIAEEIDKEDISYSTLILLEKDSNNRISALTTDIIAVNKLKALLSVEILNKLKDIDVITLKIPIGNIMNGEFFSGRGPNIEIRIIPVGSVNTDITNVFTSAGINQTRHQLMLNVDVEVSVIMPFSVETTNILTTVCIAETVIVGDVPNTYAKID